MWNAPSLSPVYLNTRWINFLIALLLCSTFSWWFARQQILLLDPQALYPPLRLMAGTGIRVGLIALLPYFYCHVFLQWRGAATWSALLILLPLSACCLGLPLPWALRISLALILGIVIYFSGIRDRVVGLQRKHGIALALITAAHVLFNGYFTPLQLANTPFHLPGTSDPENAVIAPLYKSFIWIKQYSLSSLDYGYWGVSPSTLLNFESPLLQIMAWAADSPSVEVMAFHRLMHWLFFFLCVGGSFGFYLLLFHGMRLSWRAGIFGGMLYIFAQQPFFYSVLERDYINEIAPMTMLPFGLCLMFCALRNDDAFLASLSGAALGAVYLLLAPHPEPLFYMLLTFAILTLARYAAMRDGPPMSRCAWLIGCSAFWFGLLSAFQLGPMLIAQISGEMVTKGHDEFPGAGMLHRMDFNLNIIALAHLFIAFKACRVLMSQMDKREKIFPVTVFVYVFLLAIMHSPFLVFLTDILHINIDLAERAFARRGCFIAFNVLMLAIWALDKRGITDFWKKKFQKRIVDSRMKGWKISHLVIIAVAVIYLFNGIQPNLRANPRHCPYYITLGALLPNTPLLQGDKANAILIRERLGTFEKDIKRRDAVKYAQPYLALLQQSGLSDAQDLAQTTELYAFARKAAPIIDRFYTDSSYNCVHPAENSYYFDGKRMMLPNMAEIYSALEDPMHFIISFTGGVNFPGLSATPNNAEGIAFGTGPGLFVQNSTTNYDARYTIGPVLLHALYLIPGYSFKPLGGVDFIFNRNWNMTPDILLNSLYRKILNIAGTDMAIVPTALMSQFNTLPQLVPLAQEREPSLPALKELTILRNDQSYGMAYLANHIEYVNPAEIVPLERELRRLLLRNPEDPLYLKMRDLFYAKLNNLRERQDILLEETARPAESGNAGNIAIRNILGEATVMRADCKRKECELVYNLAKVLGWHAYVNGEPVAIARANFAFMALPLSQGLKEVWFVYAPARQLGFSLISLLALLILPFMHILRHSPAKGTR